MIKILNKQGIEVNYTNVIKAIYENLTANIILNSQRLKSFLLRSEQDKDASFSHL